MIKLQHNQEKCPTKFIKKACKVYNAEFLGRFSYSDDNTTPAFFFYCQSPQDPSHSKYFALYKMYNCFYISSGSHFEGRQIYSLKINDKYYYSSSVHDFVSIDGFFIDGGDLYTRTNAPDKLVKLTMKDGEWHESTRFEHDS